MSSSTESERQQADALGDAILQHAKELAAQQQAEMKQMLYRIHQESGYHLQLQEQQTIAQAQEAAQQQVVREVQAAQMAMRADLDRLCWQLVDDVLHKLEARLQDSVQDEKNYLLLLFDLLKQAADCIEQEQLVAKVTALDYARLQQQTDNWQDIVTKLGIVQQVELKTLSQQQEKTAIGGILVCSIDERICVDNTFHGQLERNKERLRQIILARLLPADESPGIAFTELSFNG
ncbi:V-type ATP synthase subunit E family protein [Candidatus Venteria ishoeyi]|uniref:V-type ATP synthase subunit E family protein n=1 Tax=Candidatus Venteria ishoeyi TaxID=1899563 RepID=UPI0025A50D0C|nr:V-type ATP synthase subunit E family protein [Candidatus Venteria ishoeyi]MDM8546651.1 V-type ATP synthase subunit E family protein [Candidatus Venteria ishoeyi]